MIISKRSRKRSIVPMGLLITTCQHYFSNVTNVIDDIETCHFPKENVLIVSGQENENTTYRKKGIQIVKVTYSGLHLTGPMYLLENNPLPHIKYWILLPDTIKLTASFYKNIITYYNFYLKNKETYSLPFINPKIRPTTMDMGIVHINHIHNMRNYLHKLKHELPYTKKDLLVLKKQLIIDENVILGLKSFDPKGTVLKSFHSTPTQFIINEKSELSEKIVIINGKQCNEVYFPKIGLYKYQRNFNGIIKKLVMKL